MKQQEVASPWWTQRFHDVVPNAQTPSTSPPPNLSVWPLSLYRQYGCWPSRHSACVSGGNMEKGKETARQVWRVAPLVGVPSHTPKVWGLVGVRFSLTFISHILILSPQPPPLSTFGGCVLWWGLKNKERNYMPAIFLFFFFFNQENNSFPEGPHPGNFHLHLPGQSQVWMQGSVGS